MKKYDLHKLIYDLKDSKAVELLRIKYKSYFTQRIENSSYALMYYNDHLVFARRCTDSEKDYMMLIHIIAPKEIVRAYWSTYNLRKLSQHFYNLFYNQKSILL